MKILALIADTFREIYAKKVILGIVGIQIVTLGITALVLFSGMMQGVYSEAARGTLPAAAQKHAKGAHEAPPATAPTLPDSAANDTALLGTNAPLPFDTVYTDSGTHAPSRALSDTLAGGVSLHVDGGAMLSDMVRGQMGAYAAVVALAVVFLGIFATAGIIPSMMEKGAVDLLLSKPLSRGAILFGRAFGGVLAIAINLAVFDAAIWALYGFATGVWHAGFLLWAFVIPLYTFIVIYSGVILLNVVTESWILPMSLAYVHLMILANFLFSREQTLFTFIGSPVLRRIIDGLYYLLPQTSDMIGAVGTAVYTSHIESMAPFVQGAIFSVVTLTWAAWRFRRKDF